jgi:hypothetical protein
MARRCDESHVESAGLIPSWSGGTTVTTDDSDEVTMTKYRRRA